MARSKSPVVDEIVDMAVRGMSPRAIAREKGMISGMNRIYLILHKARKAGAPIPRHNGLGQRGEPGTMFRISITLPMHRQRLETAAKKRSLTRTQLLNRVISIALHENLVDSILDDGVKSDA